MRSLRVLIVDDDLDHARSLAADLEPRLGRAVVVPDAYQALSIHAEAPFDVVLLEVALPGASGIDLLERLAPSAPAVVLTWLRSPVVDTRARQAGAHAVLAKPCGLDHLVAALEAAARSQGPAVLLTA